MRRLANNVAGAIERACRAAAVGLGSAIFLLMLAGIAGRHVFSDGLPAVTELPEQLFPWWIGACIVLAARHGAHVAVEAFSQLLHGAARHTLLVFIRLATIAMSAGVVWTLVAVAAISGSDRSPILGLPLIHMHIALALTFAAIAVLALCELVEGKA